MSADRNPIGWQPTFNDLGKPLSQTTFVVVDLETTGGSPKNGSAITEIGAVKIRGGEVLGEFKTFVNPLAPIPAYITVLTGITDAMVVAAPTIESALPNFLEFCGSSEETVLVAHNAPFDIGFLKAAAADLDYQWPSYAVVDTARVARLVLAKDEVPNCKLATLAIFFNTQVKPTHRALDDAQTTVDVLYGLFERLGVMGVQTLEDLQNFTHRVSPEQRAKKHLADGIPAVAGVYIFKDAQGAPLYIGVSKNLRNRVRSYFSAAESRSRIKEMIRIADRIEIVQCATVIEANVRELRLIAERVPRYNKRSMKQFRGIKKHHFRKNYQVIADGLQEKMNSLSLAERFEEAADIRNRLNDFVHGVYRGQRIQSISEVRHLITARPVEEDWEFVCIRYGRFAGSAIAKAKSNISEHIEALRATSEVISMPLATHEESEKILTYIESDGIRIVEIDGTWVMPAQGAGTLWNSLNDHRSSWNDFATYSGD